MHRAFRFVLRLSWGATKLALFLGGAVIVAAVTTYITVDRHFQASEVIVPDVLELALGEAGAVLAAADLTLRVDARRAHDLVDEGRVFFQQPLAGTRTRRKRQVRVVLSTGPHRTVIPDLEGQTARRARLTLNEAGLKVADVLRVHVPGSRGSEVMAQEPPAGAVVHDAGGVDLLVSLGQPKTAYVMPDFRGRTVIDVELALAGVGMRVSTLTSRIVHGVPGGRVHSQLPPPGSRVFPESPVSLVVSREIETAVRDLPQRPRFHTR